MAQVKAVIDRFEDEHAVLLIGEAQTQIVVLRWSLPKGVCPGQWLKVEIDGETLISANIDEEETDKTKQRILDKLAALKRGDHLR